jgi:hypothetical protein
VYLLNYCGSGQQQVTHYCEKGNEILNFLNAGNFLLGVQTLISEDKLCTM